MTVPINKILNNDSYKKQNKIKKEQWINPMTPLCQRCKKKIEVNSEFYFEEDKAYHAGCLK